MPRTWYGPFSEKDNNYAVETVGNANLGRLSMGARLVLPDERSYRFALNDGTVEVAGNLYQGVASVGGHVDDPVDTAQAVGDTQVNALLNATAAAVDIYAEGVVHIDAAPGEGYAYRISRAFTVGAAHAAATSTGVLTVNLAADESVQVALTTASDATFTRNRYHQILITAAPPTASLAGVSPGGCAADRFYWSQVGGPAAVLAEGTLLVGLPVQASQATAGAVQNRRRTVRSTGATVRVVTTHYGHTLEDQDGSATAFYVLTTATATAAFDISSGIADNSPVVGECIKANASADYALIDLNLDY